MACLLAILGLFFPRLVILLVWIFSDYLSRAVGSWLLILLGFLFLPFTTLACAAAINEGGGIHGLWIVLVVVAVLADLGLLGNGGAQARRK